jgi:putative ABC transport system permease protein
MWSKCRAFLQRRRLDAETRREVDAHIELLAERYERDGMRPRAARDAARRQFGNPAWMREEVHHLNGIGWFDSLSQDLRYALRQARRSPGFSAVVIATLALGIGGVTAVFSVVQAVLIAPLPYAEPDRLVRLYQRDPQTGDTRGMTAVHFHALRESARSFSGATALYAYSADGLDLFHGGDAHRLRVLPVTSDYFRTLHPGSLRGPGFTPDDEQGRRRKVVLGDSVWRTRFGGDASVIGSTVQLDAEPYEIVGIAAPGFDDPIVGAVEAWIPYNLADARAASSAEEDYGLAAIVRLADGVTLDRAQSELATLSRSMKARWPATRMHALIAVPLKDDLVGASRRMLHVLLAAVWLVLLVSCVNVANLMLVRATGRTQEFAVRAALGSGRVRVARQLLVESGLLAVTGGLAGGLLAWLGVDVLRQLGDAAFPRIDEAGFDPNVLSVAALVTFGTAVLVGLVPALRLARVSPQHALVQQSRSTTGGIRQRQIRAGLVVAQLAVALTLLAGTGALLASFHRLSRIEHGFRDDRVLSFELHLPGARYDADRRAAFYEEFARRIETIPGVRAAGGISYLPATGDYHHWPTTIETGPSAGMRITRVVQQRTVSGRFFDALEIPVLAGRVFDARDSQHVPPHAVVSENFARRAFPGMPLDRVIGQRIRIVNDERREIIGVVGNVTTDVYGTPAPAVYHAHRQFASDRNWALKQVVATNVPPEQVLRAIRAEAASLDPALVVYEPLALSELMGRGVSRQRFVLVIMGVFATVAVMLAALGLYGVLAYAVRQRTEEIGIRLALGATAGQARRLILRQAAVVIGVGILLGLAGAVAMGRWVSSLLFKTSPWEPAIIGVTTIAVVIIAFAAVWLPARRASRVNPRTAMQGS